MLRVLLALAAVVGSALFLACGGDDDDSTTDVTEAPTSVAASASPTSTKAAAATVTPEETQTPAVDVAVTLSEYEVVTDFPSGPAGDYTFSIANEGPAETHVFMIVQTDLAPEELPVTSNGQFAPSSAAVILANTPSIGANATDSFSFDLEAGKYVFICNNVDAEGQGHYGKGMRTGFTVE